jgi:hypothetical protein
VFFEAGQAGTRASTACQGSAADPTAAPGHLCVYTGILVEAEPGAKFGAFQYFVPIVRVDGQGGGANTAGAALRFEVDAETSSGTGSFAVTAPAAP